MIAKLSVAYQTWIGFSNIHIFILPVDVEVGKSWVVGVLVVDSFEFCLKYFLSVIDFEC